MSAQATLKAEIREGVRKGANRRLRATGRVPAVLYGKDHEPTLLSVDAREAERLFQQISVENTIIEIKLKGDSSKIQALVREVQVGAVRPDLVHIDFYKVQVDDLDWDLAAKHGLTDDEAFIITYFADIEGQTIVYLRDFLHTRAALELLDGAVR